MRTDEVRYSGTQYLREQQGHFSPGPQYAVPGLIGGAPANRFTAEIELQKNRMRHTGMAPLVLGATGRTSLDSASLGGEPIYSLTSGSFCDPTRAPEPDQTTTTSYWRQSTMLQPGERSATTPFKSWSTRPTTVTHEAIPWTENHMGPTCYGTDLQLQERGRMDERCRNQPGTPYRNLPDVVADPPLANVFGPLKSHADYGTVQKLGGINRAWRESKIQGSNTTAALIGPPHVERVRCARGRPPPCPILFCPLFLTLLASHHLFLLLLQVRLRSARRRQLDPSRHALL